VSVGWTLRGANRYTVGPLLQIRYLFQDRESAWSDKKKLLCLRMRDMGNIPRVLVDDRYWSANRR